jgi:DNA polymerase III delta prime subunit
VNIDSLRKLQELTHLKAFDGGHKVVLVSDADTLSEGAWNSLLKFLEEPPLNLTVMLTARSEYAVPATVRSRTAILRLHPVKIPTLRAALEKQGIAQDVIAWALPRSAGLPGRLATLLTERGAAEQKNSEERISFIHQSKTISERWQELQKLSKTTQISSDELKSSLEHLEQADHSLLTAFLRGQGAHHGGTWSAMLKRRKAYRWAHAAARRNSSPTSVLFSLALNT